MKQLPTAEEWLLANAKDDDTTRDEGLLKDSLWTNNVLDYMVEFAKIHVEASLEAAYHETSGGGRLNINNYRRAYPLENIK